MLNQVTIVGRLTKDPEIKRTADGKAVTNVTVALNRTFKNQDGEFDTDFISCTIWRKTAENTALYCRKGSVVGVVGRLQSRSYEKEGNRIYVTEVVAESVRFLSTKPVDSGSGSEPAKETVEELLVPNQ